MKFVNDDQRDWDLFLDSILFSYRVSRQDSTKHSPFLLVYGRHPKLPIEINMDAMKEDSKDKDNVEDDHDNIDIELQDTENDFENRMNVCVFKALIIIIFHWIIPFNR